MKKVILKWQYCPLNFVEMKKWGKFHLKNSKHLYNKNSLYWSVTSIYFGLYYKYPVCCILYFAYKVFQKVLPASFIASKLKNEQEYQYFKSVKHVPCPRCIKNKS